MKNSPRTAWQGSQSAGPAVIAADEIDAQPLLRLPEPPWERRVAWLDGKDYTALPVIWIENQGLLDAQTEAAMRAAWQRAERHKTSERGASG